MDSGDTTWVMISAALVFIMTPGVALFYGGLARRKNVLSILMQCFVIMCLVTLQWVLFGYSLAFGPDTGYGIIGGLDWAGLRGVGMEPNPDYSETIPHLVFMIFQAQFAIITAALMVGAFAERMKFSAFLVLILLWTTFVYDPIAHWVWGPGGWLGDMGALDFAGGIVVHVSSGVSALLVAILIGRRIGLEKQAFTPHNLPITVLKPKLGYDDSLDVFGLHGVAGIWGTIAVGIFAAESLAGTGGLLAGNAKLLLIQFIYMVFCIAYALAVTWILFKIVDFFVGIRVSREDEIIGLDLTQHQEGAYTVLE
ncbi:MAG: ammonium transporter [Syntrophales bacterium]|nr:ammonium transporter [Syntrophales bacterium]